MTYGEKAVGSFNPNGDPAIEEIKFGYAKLITMLHRDIICDVTAPQNKKVMAEKAIDHAMTAQMWAVKAVTWEE
jgi:hypothetical protein